MCFFLNRIKFFRSLSGKSSQNATKTALAVYSMLITFRQEGICVVSGLYACRLAPKLL